MILYVTISNQGGMKRVAESFKHNPNVVFAILSKKKISLKSKNFHWIKWGDNLESYSEENKKIYIEQIEQILHKYPFKLVIADSNTLEYLPNLKLPYIFDIHILAIPLMNRLLKNKNRLILNSYLPGKSIFKYEIDQLRFIKYEKEKIDKAAGFITNSKNTTRDLKKHYLASDDKRPIYQVPVSSELNVSKKIKKTKTKIDFYCYSRWSAQKGFQNILLENFKPKKLKIRGIIKDVFSPEAQKKFKAQGISILPWTHSDSVIKNELMNSDIVLFPSIYEPWGLALQEALSLGCLCVAHKNDSGHEEQIKHLKNGILIDMEKEGWFKSLNQLLLKNKHRIKEIKSNAKKSIRLNHDERSKKLEIVFKKLLKRF